MFFIYGMEFIYDRQAYRLKSKLEERGFDKYFLPYTFCFLCVPSKWMSVVYHVDSTELRQSTYD